MDKMETDVVNLKKELQDMRKETSGDKKGWKVRQDKLEAEVAGTKKEVVELGKDVKDQKVKKLPH